MCNLAVSIFFTKLSRVQLQCFARLRKSRRVDSVVCLFNFIHELWKSWSLKPWARVLSTFKTPSRNLKTQTECLGLAKKTAILTVSHLSFTTPTSEMDLAVSEIWYGQTKHSVPICAWPNKLGNSLFRTFNYQPPSIQQSLYYAHIAKRSQLISTKWLL